MRAGAYFEWGSYGDEFYRYLLWRKWDKHLPTLCSIGLNPSSADEKTNDPTVRTELVFAKLLGFGAYLKLNLFAVVSTDPSILRRMADAVGPGNDEFILKYAHIADKVVLSCGVHPNIDWRLREVLMLLTDIDLYCYDLSKSGYPVHPLRKAAFTKLQLYRSRVV